MDKQLDILDAVKRKVAIKLVNQCLLTYQQNQDVASLVFDRGVDALILHYSLDELIDML